MKLRSLDINKKFSATSNILAKQAKEEIRLTGKTKVRCPKCNTPPVVKTTPGGERTTVSCLCGYVFDGEINL